MPEALEVLRDLIRFDTSNPPGHERPAAEYIAALLKREGIPAELIEAAPGRTNVVARLRGRGVDPPLLLSAHLDVVPAPPEGWTHPPFAAEVADGYVWGRGAVDMKHMAAMGLAVLLELARSKAPLRRDVVFAGVADEEAGGGLGAGYLVDKRPELIAAGFALTELGGMAVPMGRRTIVPVQVAERGYLWFRLRARGDGGHGSTPRPGSAVERLARAVERLSRKPLRYHLTESARGFVRCVARSRPPASLVLLGLLSEKTAPLALRALPAERRWSFRAMLYDTACVTVLSAGTKVNVVALEASAMVDGRYLPGVSRRQFLEEVRSVVGPDVEIEPVAEGSPTVMPPNSALMEAIRRGVAREIPGGEVVGYLMPGLTDAKHYARAGIVTYGFAPVRLRADEPFATLYHAPDERISVEGFAGGLRLLRAVVEEFCLDMGEKD